jgi:hypothetical protein
MLRPELNGTRMRDTSTQRIYLIDQGWRRWIPSPTCYENIFANWDNILTMTTEDGQIDEGPAISETATIIEVQQADGHAYQYFLDPGAKLARLIPSPTIISKYNFTSPKAQVASTIFGAIFIGSSLY